MFTFSVLLNSLCYFLINATTIVFLHCFYDQAFLWHKKKFWLFAAAAVIHTGLSFVFPNNDTLVGALLLIPYAVIAIYDHKGGKWRAFWRFELYSLPCQLLIMSFGTLAAFCIYPELIDQLMAVDAVSVTPSLKEMVPVNILAIIFFGVLFFCLRKLYRKGVAMRCGKGGLWALLIAGILSSIMMAFIWAFLAIGFDRFLLYPLTLLGICFSFLLPVFIYSSRVGEYYRNRSVVQEQNMQAELAHFTQYKQAQEETARFRHDIRNHLLCLNNLLTSSKTEEATQYLHDLLFTAEELRQKYVSGDEMLDCIISVKANEMAPLGIQFSLDGVLAGGLTWKPMDICNVFANALDNAIEACQKVAPEKRQISMRIKSTPQFWLVSIENSVVQAVDVSKLFQKNGGYTSKSDSAKHGIGTYNMKHTVESYGAMLKAECTDEIFKLEIIIDKSSPE